MSTNIEIKLKRIIILLLSIIVILLIAIIALLFVNKDLFNINKTNQISSTMSGSKNTNSNTGKLIAEKVYFVYNDNSVVFSKTVLDSFVSLGKKYNQELIPVLPNNPVVKNIIKAAGDKVYYPMFVFDIKSPNVKYSELPKNEIFEDKQSGLFAVKEPLILNLPKIIFPRNKEIDSLLNKYEITITQNKNKNNNSYILAIEDPLCPYCSKSFLDKATIEAIGDNTLKHVYYPLPITSHKNSNVLIGLLRTNNQKEVIETIFRNQEILSKVEENEVKKTLQNLLNKNKIKIKLKDGKKYSKEELDEAKKILLKLGVIGTPTYFVVNQKEIILLGTIDMIKKLLNNNN